MFALVLCSVLCVLSSESAPKPENSNRAILKGRTERKPLTLSLFGPEKCGPKAQRCQPSKQIPALGHKDEKSAVASATADDDGVQTCVKPKQQTDKAIKQTFPSHPNNR